jgi:hypothetical protein
MALPFPLSLASRHAQADLTGGALAGRPPSFPAAALGRQPGAPGGPGGDGGAWAGGPEQLPGSWAGSRAQGAATTIEPGAVPKRSKWLGATSRRGRRPG